MAYVNELSGSKLRSKMGYSLNENVAAPTSSFAKKQLEKMGWKEGDGLGKNRQGMAKHIRVKKREDEIGLGHLKSELKEQNQWWNEGMSSILSRLSGVAKKSTTDEDLFKATNGKRFGMRAQRKQIGKWNRTEIITKEEEIRAKDKMEWNGQGEAKIILKKKKKKKREDGDEIILIEKKRKRDKDCHIDEDEHRKSKRSKKKKAKKKRKTLEKT